MTRLFPIYPKITHSLKYSFCKITIKYTGAPALLPSYHYLTIYGRRRSCPLQECPCLEGRCELIALHLVPSSSQASPRVALLILVSNLKHTHTHTQHKSNCENQAWLWQYSSRGKPFQSETPTKTSKLCIHYPDISVGNMLPRFSAGQARCWTWRV